MTVPKKWTWGNFYQTRGNQVLSLVKGMVGSTSNDGKRIVVRQGSKTCITDNGSTRTLEIKSPDVHASDDSAAQDRRVAYVAALNAKEGVKCYDVESDDVTRNIASVLDGGRMRMDIIDDYPGDKHLFGTEACDIATFMKESKLNPSQKLTNMLALAGVSSVDLDSFSKMAEVMSNDPEVADLWDKADKKGLVRDAMNMVTPEDAHKLARALKKFIEDERPEDQEGMGDGEGGGDATAEGEEGDGDETEASGRGGGKPTTSNEWKLTEGNEPFYTDTLPPRIGPVEMPVEFNDYVNDSMFDGSVPSNAGGWGNQVSKIVNQSKHLADDLRTLLQVRSQSHYVKNQKRGKLARTSVWKIACPTVGSGQWNTQVFRKKVVNDCLDTAVTLLVDCSGSMSGEKFRVACAAAIVMSDALDVLGVPYEVIGFSTAHKGGAGEVALLSIFKQFSTPNVPSNMLNYMADAAGRLRNNPDGPAVRFAVNRLCGTRSKRRVMLTLSDGQPATGSMDDDASLRQAIEYANASGVEVYGIGIFSSAVTHYYGRANSQVIDDLSNNKLAEVLLDVLSNKLI